MTDVKRANILFLEGKVDEAIELYKTGAGEGDRECAFNYGYCLYHGYGVPVSRGEAKSYFVFASELDGGDSLYNLAVMYLYGDGVKRDFKRCYEYMRDAASLGSIEAMLYLGIAHTLGSLFEPDVRFISGIPFHKAEYMRELGELYGFVPDRDAEADEEARMTAVRLDPVTAFEYFRAAARRDGTYTEELSRTAKYLYARCFLDGLGTDFNLKRAGELMLIAASEGSAEAMYYLQTDAPYLLETLDNDLALNFLKRREGIGSPKEE